MAQLVLAQSGVQSLPSPPVLTRILLEDPLLPAAVLIIASVAAFFILNSRAQVKKAILYSAIGMTLSIAILLLAHFIQTDREKIMAATTPLVRATAAADTSRLSPLLDPSVRLTNDFNLAGNELPHGESWDKAQILRQVDLYINDRMRLKPGATAIVSIQGIIDSPGRGRTQAQVRVVTEHIEIPWITWWRIDWKLNDRDEWVVTGIQPLDVGLPIRRR